MWGAGGWGRCRMCDAIEQVARPAIASGAVLAHGGQETWPVRLALANSHRCSGAEQGSYALVRRTCTASMRRMHEQA
jgi:hypothetical protein